MRPVAIREVLIDREFKDHGVHVIRYTNDVPKGIKRQIKRYIKKDMVAVLIDAMNYYKYNREFKRRCRLDLGYNPINSNTIKVVSTYLAICREQGAAVLVRGLKEYNSKYDKTKKL
jgi:hypothetical protein